MAAIEEWLKDCQDKVKMNKVNLPKETKETVGVHKVTLPEPAQRQTHQTHAEYGAWSPQEILLRERLRCHLIQYHQYVLVCGREKNCRYL